MRQGSLRLIGAAALLTGLAQPAAAQTANGVPPRDTPTKPAPKIDPKQVADFINGLVNPKPKPTPTAAPTPTPAPVPTQAVVPTPGPPPSPSPKPVATPAPKAAPGVVPRSAPLPRPVPQTAPSPAAEPSDAAAPTPANDLASPPPLVIDFEEDHDAPPASFPWAPIGALIVVAAAAGYGLRRWFWPKLALGCRIDTGAPQVTGTAQPLASAPELQILVEIELGTPSSPRGLTIS